MTPTRQTAGSVLVMLLAGLALMAAIVTFSAAALLPSEAERAAAGCATQLQAQLQRLSAEAAAEGRNVGLVFPLRGNEPLFVGRDDNGNGLMRSEIASGVDRRESWFDLARDQDRCRVEKPDLPGLLDIPPSRAALPPGSPPVRLGASRMAVFSEEGGASPGTIFISAGESSLCAVTIASTSRTRVWCWDRSQRSWRQR